MKQIVMTGPRRSKIIDVPVPAINDDQLLVKVTYTGMCHSEWYPWSTAKPGEVFGHETVGVVAKCGRNVADFKEGDRVTGLGGGGYREYIVMEPEKTCHVPDNLKDEDAIVEPLACLLSAALKMPWTTLGDPIAVVGAGYMGLGMITLFRAMGYGDIVAIDKRPEARENAKKMGATEVLAPEEIPAEYRLDWTAIGTPDLTRDGHKTDIFGIGGYHNNGPRTIDYKLWNFKAIDTINCHERRIMYEAGLCRRCLMLLSRGIWKFTGMTTHYYSMEEFDKANEDMELHRGNFIKGVVRC